MSDSTPINTELLTGLWDCSIQEYHSDRQWLSHSALELFRKSPRLYRNWYRGEWEREKTPEFRLGSALHAMLLEPDSFYDRFKAIDCASRNSNTYKEAAIGETREILLRHEFGNVIKMASEVKCHGWINDLLEDSWKEQAYRFVDPTTGIPCKVRPDGMKANIVFDLKTSRNPSEEDWVRDATRLGYHRQAAFYLHGLYESRQLAREKPVCFLHIVVGSVVPFDVFAYQLDDEAIALGAKEFFQSLSELKERRDNDDWTERNYGKIANVSLPRWYLAKGWE